MKKTLVAALLCACAAAPVLAQSQEGHWYGAVDFGSMNMKNSAYPDPNTISLSGGYRFDRHLAAEASVLAAGDTSITDATGTQTLRQSALTLAAVGHLPLSDRFELFGKVGAGFNHVRPSGTGAYASNTDPYTTINVIGGVGAQVNFSQRFGMRLQYEALGKAKSSATDSGADLYRLSVGAMLNF